MKSFAKMVFLFTSILVFFSLSDGFAQERVSTKISYAIDSGPVYPIDGESVQMTGQLTLDDTTGELQKLSFTVPIISFIGSYGGYLAWLGNARRNPDMNFKSSTIVKKKNHWEVNGQLEFRRMFKPLTITLNRIDGKGEIVLKGKFQISTSDYFMGPVPSELVAPWIPFEFTMVYEKPKGTDKVATLSTN